VCRKEFTTENTESTKGFEKEFSVALGALCGEPQRLTR
jgi:hypothetical protein